MPDGSQGRQVQDDALVSVQGDKQQMSNDTKFLLIIGGLTVLVVGLITINSSSTSRPTDSAVIERGGIATGSAQPKATLVEFSDFQCPACKAVEPYLKTLIEKYAQDLKFIYRHFPLPQHALAFKAAQASLAADNQGQFWAYKEKLFARQEGLKEADFEEIARELNLDFEKFKKEMNEEKTIARVQQDLKDAQDLKLPGTPGFFLNGEKLTLNSFADLAKLVAEKLR